MYCYRTYYTYTKLLYITCILNFCEEISSNVYLCVRKADLLYALTSIDLGFNSECYIRCTANFRCTKNVCCTLMARKDLPFCRFTCKKILTLYSVQYYMKCTAHFCQKQFRYLFKKSKISNIKFAESTNAFLFALHIYQRVILGRCFIALDFATICITTHNIGVINFTTNVSYNDLVSQLNP